MVCRSSGAGSKIPPVPWKLGAHRGPSMVFPRPKASAAVAPKKYGFPDRCQIAQDLGREARQKCHQEDRRDPKPAARGLSVSGIGNQLFYGRSLCSAGIAETLDGSGNHIFEPFAEGVDFHSWVSGFYRLLGSG